MISVVNPSASPAVVKLTGRTTTASAVPKASCSVPASPAAARRRAKKWILSSSAIPSTTDATRLVVRLSVMPLQPRMPKNARIGRTLGISASAASHNERNIATRTR